MTEKELQECLLRGYGYRKSTELRGEYIANADGSVVNTLHTEEVWTRDGELPPNPMNEPQCVECDDRGCSECEEREEEPDSFRTLGLSQRDFYAGE